MNQPEKGDSVRAVGRALEILLAFTPQDFELSAAQLLTRVDLSRPTLYRLLYSLEEHGFIQSVGEPQRFRLGPSIAKLAHVWTSSLDISVVADPILRRIWMETSETVALFIPQGAMRLCIAELPSPQPLNFKRGIGHTERIVRGATGRAILAFMEVTSQELREWAADPNLDVAALESELTRTRKRGYTTSHSELIVGAIAVAAPFFDRRGEVAGSVGVYGPEVRMNAARQKEIAKVLMKETDALSRALGYTGAAATS